MFDEAPIARKKAKILNLSNVMVSCFKRNQNKRSRRFWLQVLVMYKMKAYEIDELLQLLYLENKRLERISRVTGRAREDESYIFFNEQLQFCLETRSQCGAQLAQIGEIFDFGVLLTADELRNLMTPSVVSQIETHLKAA